jgi:hypothetical protein
MDISGLELLAQGLVNPSRIGFFCYGSVYYVAVACLLFCLVRFRRRAYRDIQSPSKVLIVAAFASVVSGFSLPIIYRILASETPSHVWECDSVLLFFSAFAEKWSIWDFAKYSVIHKPGVLAASAHTLFWGVPTYAVMQLLGWSEATFLSVSFLMGSASVLVGFWIARLLFNSGVAWCFVLIFALNPALIYNMGYGVAQTGTLFAVLGAIFFTFRALLCRTCSWGNISLATMFLFGATLNYGPGRVFVVAILMFLGGVVLAALLWRRIERRVSMAALMVLFLAGTVLIVENRFNKATDFTSMRGEQAFHQHQWKDNLIRLLGDTPEVRALDPQNLPTLMRARFIFASAVFGFGQFVASFSPTTRLHIDRRGYGAGNEICPYQSGLIVFIILGFLMGVRNATNAIMGRYAERPMSHWFILALFFISLAPLTLVNRLDQHRSFILVYPVSMWAAVGLWACFRRMYANGMPIVIVGSLACALSLSLSMPIWRVFGTPEKRNSDISHVLDYFSKTASSAQVLGGAGLICQELQPLDFTLVQMSRERSNTSWDYFHHIYLAGLSDQYLSAGFDNLVKYLDKYGSVPVAFVSADPMIKFEQAMRERGFSVSRAQIGRYYSWLIRP